MNHCVLPGTPLFIIHFSVFSFQQPGKGRSFFPRDGINGPAQHVLDQHLGLLAPQDLHGGPLVVRGGLPVGLHQPALRGGDLHGAFGGGGRGCGGRG